MITIILIWINVVISGFILVSESELWGMRVSLSISPTHREKDVDAHHSLSSCTSVSITIFHTLTFTEWPTPFTFLGCLSIMRAASRIHICRCNIHLQHHWMHCSCNITLFCLFYVKQILLVTPRQIIDQSDKVQSNPLRRDHLKLYLYESSDPGIYLLIWCISSVIINAFKKWYSALWYFSKRAWTTVSFHTVSWVYTE